MSRPITGESYRYPPRKVADADHRAAVNALAEDIRRDEKARRRRRRLLTLHPEQEDRGDRLMRYLERERARRQNYIRSHLSVDTVTVRRKKP